jgi:radical SAM protein with 4Fe4S-binding SPASM domain
MAEIKFKQHSNIYNKYCSFSNFYSNSEDNIIIIQKERSINLIKKYLDSCNNDRYANILNLVLSDLLEKKDEKIKFKINLFIADEVKLKEDNNIPLYFFHRYRYDISPQKYQLDNWPPCIQIEPSSICNYRCIFCYQKSLSKYPKINGYMDFELYKNIIDQIKDNIQFISLASRGEPFLCKDINKMLAYSAGKFIGFKINTNASVLTEKNIHSILSGGVSTIVFSVDVIDEREYAKIRINGKFNKIFKNIEKFQKIKQKHYPDTKIISRISGVKINDSQNIDKMKDFWRSLVDQIAIVSYCPWENTYELKDNDVENPCQELWRRMFIWYNGSVNPCENDFLSFLNMGNIDNNNRIDKIWISKQYKNLREKHIDKKRKELSPCSKCLFG